MEGISKQQVANLYIVYRLSYWLLCIKQLSLWSFFFGVRENNQLGRLVLTTHKHRGYSKLVFWLTWSFIMPLVFISFYRFKVYYPHLSKQ